MTCSASVLFCATRCAAWASLEKYASGDAKPRSKKAQLKKVDALSAERHGADYPERRAFLVGSSKDEL